jgi:H+/Cl- antiporter ClcA
MRTALHALIAVALTILLAASVHATAYFGWLTAYYTRQDLIRAAQIRANIWLAVLVVALVGFALNAWWWWRLRRKVG